MDIFLRSGFAILAVFSAAAPAQQSGKPVVAQDLTELQQLVKPQPGEAGWEQVSWMPSNDIWAARRKAAEEGKPILLWYMAGEPLGTC